MSEYLSYLKITDDMVDKAIQFLPDNLRDKSNVVSILTLLIEGEQESYNQYIKFAESLLLDAARGWWLDRLGEENSVPRVGYSDEEYRGVIKAISGLPFYSGTTESTYTRLSALFSSTDIILYVSKATITVFVTSAQATTIVDKSIFYKFFPVGADVRIVMCNSFSTCFRFGRNSLGSSNSVNSLLGNRFSSVYFRSHTT